MVVFSILTLPLVVKLNLVGKVNVFPVVKEAPDVMYV